MGETRKAFDRRVREGFFDLYLRGRGIDVGAGTDPVTWEADTWDLFQSGMTQDAHSLPHVPDGHYDWVYSSHCLEHLDRPEVALREWWRILRPDGNLILYVPHRDLYEKKEAPPSRWNDEHKVFFVPDRHLGPKIFGLRQLIDETFRHDYQLLRFAECAEGHTITDPLVHSDGEYSIEAVVRKLS